MEHAVILFGCVFVIFLGADSPTLVEEFKSVYWLQWPLWVTGRKAWPCGRFILCEAPLFLWRIEDADEMAPIVPSCNTDQGV